MYAIEFETDITSRYLELKDYEKLANKHAKVIILVEDDVALGEQVSSSFEEFERIKANRKHLPTVDKSIDIDAVANEANRDIF
ncbi:hypothetical protein [Franzmannia qiaohouensis]|uniref:Uncharacterized protein n=1 Tax=Franzmannia qiaohouensis TaxID=1329370 RepID=A0ABU1HJZ0_9GAMM|nr:hypothetical protein [Halomonas qiaohouensis]MDR5907807.1 hypothetical protein [Halomonas qiaohouensis]